MELKLFNTLTRKKEAFNEIKKGNVGMYTCGPTVYSFQHIGNMRAYIFSDLLKRVLLYNKLKVKHIINVTDVGHLTSDADEGEDKIEKAALKEGKRTKDIADFYFKVFKEDLKKLNIIDADKWPKASEHIKEQINLILKLEGKGYTYKTSDGIYFDSFKFKYYGELGKLNLEGLKKGKRVAFGEKKNKTDFALWKFSEEEGKRQQEWDSPWGKGFPGWHIECSAMSMRYLGEHFDIHTGGEDHVQIHHTNEIAQSECATGRKYVNYWIHGAFLTFKGEKVSKSTGGLYTIKELEGQGYGALDFRYLCLLSHYRSQLSFSLENLDSAKNAFSRMKRKIKDLRKEGGKGKDLKKIYEDEFLKAINDDLNTPIAMQIVWKMLDDTNFINDKKLKLLEKFDSVLGLDLENLNEVDIKIPFEVKKMIEEREDMRKRKLWKEADVLRTKIHKKGYLIEDTSEGIRISRIIVKNIIN